MPNSNPLRAADCSVVLQLNSSSNNNNQLLDYLGALQPNNSPLRVVICLGPNSNPQRVAGCSRAQPHNNQPVVGSLLPLEHNRANSLYQAIFSARQQRPARVCLGAAAQEH
jgi:hypothetical protein